MRHNVYQLMFIFLIALLFGAANSALRAQTAGASYKEITVSNGGTIAGTVRWAGEKPAAEPMPVTKDQKICGADKPSPRISIGPDGGIKNAVVMIEEIREGKKIDRSKKVVLDQHNCEYSPHILTLCSGTPFEIVNHDPILHNVHTYDLGKNAASMFNIAQPVKGQCTPVHESQLCKSGIVAATCDAGHPWMSAYIVVSQHPYVAITDEHGNFRLDNVPPGTYELKMWHEGVRVTKKEMEQNKVKKYYYEEPYVKEQNVAVSPKQTTQANFDFTLR